MARKKKKQMPFNDEPHATAHSDSPQQDQVQRAPAKQDPTSQELANQHSGQQDPASQENIPLEGPATAVPPEAAIESVIRSRLALKTGDRRSGATRELVESLEELLWDSDSSFTNAAEVVCQKLDRLFREPLTKPDRLRLLACWHKSVQRINKYASLDPKHLREVSVAIENMAKYLEDATQTRPRNFLMLASPGSGKSHLVDCIAQHPRLQALKVNVVSLNMTGLRSSDDMAGALDEARNVKVEDGIPLLFLDEFDSAPANFALLLPLLWDGKMSVGQRELRLGKIIIALAGSSSSLENSWRKSNRFIAPVDGASDGEPKSRDFFSRINGGLIQIPPLTEYRRRADQVAIAVQLIRRRFKDVRWVPRGLLAFVAQVDFKHDVRSLTHFVNELPKPTGKSPVHQNPVWTPTCFRDFAVAQQAAEFEASNFPQHLYHQHGAVGVQNIWRQTVGDEKLGFEAVPIVELPILSVTLRDFGVKASDTAWVGQEAARVTSEFEDLLRDMPL